MPPEVTAVIAVPIIAPYAVEWPRLLLTALGRLVASPALGRVLGCILMAAASWPLRGTAPRRGDGLFRRLQLRAAGASCLGRGGSDAQKTMGVIMALLVSV